VLANMNAPGAPNPVALVFMDLQMPIMDGFKVKVD
jgi:hypothetical protein